MDIQNENTTVRINMVTWLIIPLIGIWLGVNYIFGTINKSTIPTNSSSVKMLQAPNTPINITSAQKRYDSAITFWFDDAWLSQYFEGYEILEKRQYKGVLAVPTNLVGYDAYMNWPQIKKIYANGWEISAHSVSHNCDMDLSNFNLVYREVKNSRDTIWENGIEANTYVSPCGKYSDMSRSIISEYYDAHRLVDEGINPLPIQDKYNLKVKEINVNTTPDDVKEWVRIVKENGGWLIIMLHQIDYSGETYSTTPETLHEIVDVVDDSNLPVVLPKNIINYE